MSLKLVILAGGDEAQGWDADILIEKDLLWAKIHIDGSELLSLQKLDDLEAEVTEVGPAADPALANGNTIIINKDSDETVDPYVASTIEEIEVEL